MNKAILTGVLVLAAAAASAQSPTFRFVTAQGETTVVASENLVITFEDGTLVASNGSQTITLPVTNLVSMNFSDEEVSGGETPDPDPVDPDPDEPEQDSIQEIMASGECALYSVDGKEQGKFASLEAARKALKPGIYVIKSNGACHKIVVK